LNDNLKKKTIIKITLICKLFLKKFGFIQWIVCNETHQNRDQLHSKQSIYKSKIIGIQLQFLNST